MTESIPIRTLATLLAAYDRDGDKAHWLEPYATASRELAEMALPRANILREERTTHVERALNLLKNDQNWFRPILDWRVAELDAANCRARSP